MPQALRPVWLASYPRSGNTFLRIILQKLFRLPTYSIYNVAGQNFSDPSAEALGEAPVLPGDWEDRVSNDAGSQLTLIKTHDPPRDNAPAIYVVRDGRAAIDSYFHYHRKFAFEKPSLTEVIAGACQFGGWGQHYVNWQPRTRAHTLFLRYEDLVAQPAGIVHQIASFLALDPVEDHLPSFEELQQRHPAFFRRGQNQDYLTRWTQDQMSLFNCLHGEVMGSLGYELTPAPLIEAESVVELAGSVARLHGLYLEQLSKLGASWAQCQQLAEDLKKLPLAQAQLAAREEELHWLEARRWVRLGRKLGLVDRRARPELGGAGLASESKSSTVTQTA